MNAYFDNILNCKNSEGILPPDLFDTLYNLQQTTNDYAAITDRGRRVGNSGMRVIARMHEYQLIALLAREPDLLKDKKNFWRILNKYPAYKAHLK